MTSLVETIQYYSSRFSQQEDQLVRHVQSWSVQCEEKIKINSDKINSVQNVLKNINTDSKNGNGNGNTDFELSPPRPAYGNGNGNGNMYNEEMGGGGGERGSDRGSGITNALLEERLFHSQVSLQNAIKCNEEDIIEKRNLWVQVQQSLKEQDRLEKVIKEMKIKYSSGNIGNIEGMRDRDRESGRERDGRDGRERERDSARDSGRERDRDSSYSHNGLELRRGGSGSIGGVGGEELYRLNERLVQAESRAVQMSALSAKGFAQSARTIAYLEGECGRLKVMVDHFR